MVEGELEHTDSLGNINRAVPGQVQHMWCGSSIWHTEAAVSTTPARYLQLWITPKDEYKDTEPYYEIIEKSPEFGPIAVALKQDMTVSAGILNNTVTVGGGYLYVVKGACFVNGVKLREGDGADFTSAELNPAFDPHILLFENR
jgi:redox-sensitive bicupin YhaK (pirin superfamily)